MALSTANQTKIYNELHTGYEVSDLKQIASVLGLAHNELKPPKAKRISAKSAAYNIATKAAPARVLAAMKRAGFAVDHIYLDDFEPADASQEVTREVEATENLEKESDPEVPVEMIGSETGSQDGTDAGDSDSESDAGDSDSESDGEAEAADAQLQDDISRYFGGGQIEVLQQIAERTGKPSGPAGSFELRDISRQETRDVEGIAPDYFQKALDLAQARLPILLVGPTGCGKSHAGEMLAEALDLRFGSLSCTEGMSEAQLSGWLLPIKENGVFDYVPAPFIDFYENGGVFLIDEIDASDANVLLFINTAIANGQMFLPQRIGNPMAKRHKDFVLIAAANTFGNGATMNFCGRNQLDKATLDRFKAGTITMDYDANVESVLIHPEILQWGRDMRERVRDANLEQSISTRFLRDLSNMFALSSTDYGRTFWDEQLVMGWSPDEASRVIF